MKRYALTLPNRSIMFVTAAHFAPGAATSRGGAVTTSDNINVFDARPPAARCATADTAISWRRARDPEILAGTH